MGKQETPIQSAIERYLRLMENSGRLMYQKNNSGAHKSMYKDSRGFMKTSFVKFGKKGSPDFLVWKPNQTTKVLETWFIEVKSVDGKLSPGQKEYQERCKALGGQYHVVRSVGEVIALLK